MRALFMFSGRCRRLTYLLAHIGIIIGATILVFVLLGPSVYALVKTGVQERGMAFISLMLKSIGVVIVLSLVCNWMYCSLFFARVNDMSEENRARFGWMKPLYIIATLAAIAMPVMFLLSGDPSSAGFGLGFYLPGIILFIMFLIALFAGPDVGPNVHGDDPRGHAGMPAADPEKGPWRQRGATAAETGTGPAIDIERYAREYQTRQTTAQPAPALSRPAGSGSGGGGGFGRRGAAPGHR